MYRVYQGHYGQNTIMEIQGRDKALNATINCVVAVSCVIVIVLKIQSHIQYNMKKHHIMSFLYQFAKFIITGIGKYNIILHLINAKQFPRENPV